MIKLNKLLLTISILTLLTACGNNIPDPPLIVHYGPIWDEHSEVFSWHGRNSVTHEDFEIDNRTARSVGMSCLDIDSDLRVKKYIADLIKLALDNGVNSAKIAELKKKEGL